MKIVHLVPFWDDRARYQEFELAKAQAAAGHEVLVITSHQILSSHNLSPHRSLWQKLAPFFIWQSREESMVAGFRVVRLPRAVGYADFVLVGGLKRELVNFGPDLVVGHEGCDGMPLQAAWYKPHFNFKLYFDVHRHALSLYPSKLIAKEYLWWRRPLVNWAYRRADRIIVTKESSLAFTKKYHPRFQDKLEYIPLGVDTKLFHFDKEARISIRHQLGYMDEDVVILWSGRAHPGKKVEQLLYAVAALPDANKESARLLFLIGGDEAYQQQLRQLAGVLGLAEMCSWQPLVPHEEIHQWQSAADVACWPALTTQAIVQAMAVGLPVVIPDELGAREYTSEEEATVFPAGDQKALQEKLEMLLSSAKKRNTLGNAGKLKVAKEFDYRVIAGRFL